eukprot:TRINITY_DN37298_c0_g1_i2.p3 TRINITY_DN37298_c0_g1~~TRINITY_DN37298_c0_g1_i2.p3  ORF type:complete len:134 (+),score=31.16 TRINITY_DN37298_c0_g1_i2:188-589(+)
MCIRDSPAAVLDGGMLLPFGGHKGAALGIVVELLGGILANSGVVHDTTNPKGTNWGHTVIVIDPQLLVPDFDERATRACSAIRASGPGVRLPGEHSQHVARAAREAGVLELPSDVWASVQQLATGGRWKPSKL